MSTGPSAVDKDSSDLQTALKPSTEPRIPMTTRAAIALWAIVLALAGLMPAKIAQAARPNVIVILADDLGYSDLGCYGGEIRTPRLYGLAAGGVRFTQFYNTARCWPSRAAVLTGYYAQQVRRDVVPGIKSGS